MAVLIKRSEALRRINRLEERAAAAGYPKGCEWITKCFNAIMSCKVEEKVFCAKCGRPVNQDPEDNDAQTPLDGQMDVRDFL